jgi:CRP/FNR family transcriptional regulator
MANDQLAVAVEPGAVAYREDWPCPNYVMCVDGRTRVFKQSDTARELLIYQVQSGGTCVLTTQCLLSGGNFPAESVAEARTLLAAIPKATFQALMQASGEFRDFVLSDYARLMSQLVVLVEQVAFATTGQRLARRLIAEAGGTGLIAKTHQQLASDVGSVREVVSRLLAEWEQAGWIATSRGEIRLQNPAALTRVT